jgi:hypothetical protein
MFLGVEKSRVAFQTYSAECVVVVDLVVCRPGLLIEGADSHGRVLSDPVLQGNIEVAASHVDVHSLQGHNQLLPKVELA